MNTDNNAIKKTDLVQMRSGLNALGDVQDDALKAVLADFATLLDATTATIDALEDEALKARRFERKIGHLVWESKGDVNVCRFCGQGHPEHQTGCIAENITILNNP